MSRKIQFEKHYKPIGFGDRRRGSVVVTQQSRGIEGTHWIGGDPARLEVYGWASWTPGKGILVLRNPSDQEKTIRIKLQGAFELPSGAAQEYFAKSPWKEDASRRTILLPAQQAYEFHLARFEVLTLDVMPR